MSGRAGVPHLSSERRCARGALPSCALGRDGLWLADAYRPKLSQWRKVLIRGYSQRCGAPNGFASTEDAVPDDDESCSDRTS
jgi:hypothetical protein